MNQPILYLLVGYPGSGKTTTAKIIHNLTDAEHIWADRERRQRFGAIYRREDSSQLYSKLNELTSDLLRAGNSVIYDTNFNYFHDRETLRRIADQADAKTVLVWLTLSQDKAYQRAVTKTKGHRLFIDMTHEDFMRVASHLEPPIEKEHAVKLDGTKVSTEYVETMLGL